jgi:hypothetical protein
VARLGAVVWQLPPNSIRYVEVVPDKELIQPWCVAVAVSGSAYIVAALIEVVRLAQQGRRLTEWFGTDNQYLGYQYLASRASANQVLPWLAIIGAGMLGAVMVLSFRGVMMIKKAGSPTEWTPGWAAGIWVVPFAGAVGGPHVLAKILNGLRIHRGVGSSLSDPDGRPYLVIFPFLVSLTIPVGLWARYKAVSVDPGPGLATRAEFDAPISWGIWAMGASGLTALVLVIFALVLFRDVGRLETTIPERHMSFVTPATFDKPSATEIKSWLSELSPSDNELLARMDMKSSSNLVWCSLIGSSKSGNPLVLRATTPALRLQRSEVNQMTWLLYDDSSSVTNYFYSRPQRANGETSSLTIDGYLLTHLRPPGAVRHIEKLLEIDLRPTAPKEATKADTFEPSPTPAQTQVPGQVDQVRARLRLIEDLYEEGLITEQERTDRRRGVLEEI